MASAPRRLIVQRTAYLGWLVYICWPLASATAQYHFDSAGTSLPQNSVSAILQIRDGYLRLPTLLHPISGGESEGLGLSLNDRVMRWACGRFSPVFDVLYPFYRGWWFAALGLLAATAIVVFGWRYRVAELKRAHVAQLAFSRQLIASQESERKRIAAELHDGLGQSLAIIKTRALLSLNEPENHRRALEQLDEIAQAASHAIDELRGIAHNLRPYHLERLGLRKSIEAMLNEISSAEGVSVRADIAPLEGLLSPEAQINIYRIVQESVNNIVKHAKATEASLTIRRTGAAVEILVQDNGKGFALKEVGTSPTRHRGSGLMSIAERARMLGGNLTIDSAPGTGTTLKIRVTLEQSPNAP
jgi:signal transduction histidine kinase